MPFYSVRFGNGHDVKVRSKVLELREMFRGREPDNAGHGVEFYCQRVGKKPTEVLNEMKAIAGPEFEITVTKIPGSEYNWKSKKKK